jgi:hypothetical protein
MLQLAAAQAPDPQIGDKSMVIDGDNLRALLFALGIIGVVMLLWALLTASPAQARLAVSAAPVAVADMNQMQEPGILSRTASSRRPGGRRGPAGVN